MKTSSVLKIACGAAFAVAGCAGGTSNTTPTTPSARIAVERPTGQQTLKKGQSHVVEINAGETHEWGIDLAAGEKVVFGIEATSTGKTMCSNWSWGFWNPAGGTLREQPKGPIDNGTWSDQIDGTAEPSIAEGPQAGRYLVRVMTDTACAQLNYTLSAK